MVGVLEYIVFDTDMGWLGITGSAQGLLSITLPQGSAQEAHRLLGDRINHATWSPGSFEDLMERLRAYFSGYKVTFADELDLSQAAPFQRQVWQITRLIAYDETRSYGWVADQIGQPKSARAVGQALGRNPLPVIVPCHRVISSDGKLGGYTGGIEMKRLLLNLEAH